MKKYLHPTFLPILVPLASILALALRLWTMGGGADADGLYTPQPFAWVLLWLVTAATLAGIYLLTRRLKNPGRYGDNFPASAVGAAGCVAGGAGCISSALPTLLSAADLLSTLTGILGLLGGAALLLTALARLKGSKPNFVLHVIASLYFALRVFDSCKHWSNLTQIGTFLFQFLASVCIMLAAYQLCCFDVNLGNRRSSLLWSLSGVYFCVLALPMGEDILFYGGMLLWLMLNLCATRPLKAPQPQVAGNPETEAPTEGTPETDTPAEDTTENTIEDILSQLEKE